MSDPLASLLIPTARQDSDGTVGESFTIPGTPFTYRLGSGLSPAYPSGMPLIPNGAAPLAAPAAPTAGATSTTGNLVANGNYKWAVTLVTKFGETTASTQLSIAALGASVVGQTINIPAATGTTSNPVIMRRIYRTKNTLSQLFLVAEIDDASVSSYVDELSDTLLVTAVPVSNTSGLEGAVTVSGAATTWTEQAPGTTLTTGGFIVDYTLTGTGGTITFFSGDAGKAVTVTYSAGTLLGSTYFNLIQAAFNLLHSTIPGYATIQSYLVSGGIPPVPGSGFIVAQPAATAVVYSATNTVTVSPALTNLTMPASQDTYVDLDNAGAYHLVSVANGAAQPALTANSIRLYKAVSNGTVVTSITQIAPNNPIAGSSISGVAVRCTHSVTVTIPSGLFTALSFDTIKYDRGTSTPQHSTTVNPTRLTCQQEGVYQINAGIDFNPNSTGVRRLILQINGTTWINWTDIGANPGSNTALSISTPYHLNVGDYMEVLVYQNSGAGLNLGGFVSNQETPGFGMTRVA